jgi:uncharacterized protein YuzE
MPLERHAFRIESATPPVVEFDGGAGAIYVRFSHRAVARTVDQHAEKMNVVVDLDASGKVVGVEAIGTTAFTLRQVLDAARVNAPKANLGNARFIMASSLPV